MIAVLFLFLALFSAPLHAAEQARVEASEEDGFGRMVFTFGKMPAYKVQIKSGVLVLSFDRPVSINLEKLNVRVPEYVLVARLDPDGRAIRFALSQKIKINTIKAGEKLFVDLLPANWSGLPPGLPSEVVAELARLASIAEQARKRAEALKKANAKIPVLNLRIGRLPTFSRLVFEWNVPVVTSMTRRKNVVSLGFDQQAKINLARLNADPPRFVRSAKSVPLKSGVRVDVVIDDTANVRGFREGVNYVLDVTGEPEVDQPDVIAKIAENQRDPLFPAIPMGAEVVHALGVPSDKPPQAGAGAKTKPAPVTKTQEKLPETKEAKLPEAAMPKPVEARVAKIPAPVVKLADLQAASLRMPGSARKIPVRAEIIGPNLKLKFAFSHEVAAAVFERAGVIWAVFDTDEKLDMDGITDVLKEKVSNIDLTSGPDVQIVRFTLNNRQLISAVREASNWIMTIGDLMLQPAKPLFLKRGLRRDGFSKVTVRLLSAGRVHWVRDPELDERLAIVTAHGPSRGMIKTQHFVEFSALKTSHGVAIRPFADDLSVRLNHDDLVITKSMGLTISSGQARQYEPGRKAISEGGRPGFLDFAEWSKLLPAQFHERLDELGVAAGDDDKKKRVAARLEMARLYLGRLWGQEALAMLKLAFEDDSGLRGDPVFNAMQGVAAILSNRFDIATGSLRVHALSQDMDTKLWRGILAVKRKDWDTAWRMFNEAATAIAKYPFHVQMEFRLAAMRAAIETGDLDAASAELEAIPGGLKGSFIPRVALLRGRLNEALGRSQEAVDSYIRARDSGSRKINVSARYYLVDIKLRNDRMAPAEAIEELETLAFRWRGDETELKVLHLLGRLYRETKRYRRALETMKMAVKVFSSMPESRLIQNEMDTLFKDLFLRGEADEMEPVKALGLFYDYAALTPPGRLGDDMIRKLADRLVKVDLLAQAEEILEHQISTRLGGAAKAEVAASLAYIYLLDHKPDRALRVIRLSRQAVMPKSIIRRRAVLEARALAELGNVGQAMDLLDSMKGDDIERLKAEALWTARNWQSAGEQIERLLDKAWKKDGALSDNERLDVLRSGVSFALAEDQLGLDRLREKFIEKMGNSPDASAFSLITNSVETKGTAFNELARKVSSLDTLKDFLENYRKRFGLGDTPKS